MMFLTVFFSLMAVLNIMVIMLFAAWNDYFKFSEIVGNVLLTLLILNVGLSTIFSIIWMLI